MTNEGPSPEDIERLDDDTAYCPECGAEIWDQADVCPKCKAYIYGNTSSRPPLDAWFQRKWFVLVIILTLIAFILIYVI